MRPVKSNNGGIGGSGTKNERGSLKRSAFKCKNSLLRRSKLKPFSAKKRRIMRENKKNLEILLNLQHELFGYEFCQLKKAFPKVFKQPCSGPFVVEHVESWRDQEKTNLLKLQVACWGCNTAKGSKNMDGREKPFIEALKELSEKSEK